MRLDRRRQIDGVSILKVRQMLRRLGPGSRNLEEVVTALGEDSNGAHRALNFLFRQGYVRRDPEAPHELRWRRTLAGDEVAAATVRQPLSRARADRVLQAFLRRAAEVNRRPYFRCRVCAVGVFGDYLTLSEDSTLDTLDLVVQLAPKPPRPGDTSGGRPLSRVPYWRLQKILRPEEWPDWEKLHVELYLLSGQPELLLHRPEDRILRGKRIRIVYLGSPDAHAPVTERTDDPA